MMNKTGMVLHHGIESGAELTGYAQCAEDSGFDSLWVTERYFHEEVFSMLGHIAASTNRIGLGVGVVNPFTRDPALLAMAAATIDRLSEGRFVLGLGRSEKSVISNKLGKPYKTPFADLETAVGTVRELLLDGSVATADMAGTIRLSVPPVQPALRIYLAAIGPKALRLAGTIGDGVILNTYAPIEYVRWAVSELRKALSDANRETSSLEVTCMLATRFTKHPESVMPGLKRRIARLLKEPGMGDLLLGRGGLDTSIADEVRKADKAGDLDTAASQVPDELVREFYLLGDEKEIRRRVEEYREAGVDQPLILPPLKHFKAVAEALSPKHI